MKAATGIAHVRFHAILHDEVGLYDEDARGQPRYNFSTVDQISDGLPEQGVRPFCADLAPEFPDYSGDIWGITASDSEKGYVAWGGPPRDLSSRATRGAP